ncbi:MAG: DUF721 domain-containing protein [Deltaproteobacteria bacterium]|nr:DUF721 domain-containing protein [Deltaproteobacteria bacterium]
MNKPTFRHRKPQSAADILTNTFKHLHIEKKLKQYENFHYWPEIVGQTIAGVTKPEKILNKKILVVRVIDSVWLQELSFKKNEYLTKLNKVSDNVYFEDIRFICGNPKQFQEK